MLSVDPADSGLSVANVAGRGQGKKHNLNSYWTVAKNCGNGMEDGWLGHPMLLFSSSFFQLLYI